MRRALHGGPAPRWGVQLIVILAIVSYFGAGVSKLRHSGLDYLDGETKPDEDRSEPGAAK